MTKPEFSLSSDTYSTELKIVSIFGTESVSKLFKIKIDFKVVESIASELNHESLLQDDIVISISSITGRNDYSIKGVFSQIEEYFKTPKPSTSSKPAKSYRYYSATLVPALWRQRNNQSYDIFTDKTAADILCDQLSKEPEFKYCLDLDLNDYPVKDFICQYSESNFNFISRLAEHWGIFYYFDHDLDGELALTDNNNKCKPLPIGAVKLDLSSDPSLNYNSIRNLKKQFNVTPSGVIITESNPDQALELFEGINGDVTEYESRFNMADEGADNKDEAEFLAEVRLQELQTEAIVYSGTTGLACITPGFVLTVCTPTEELEILIISVSHNGNYLDESALTQSSGCDPYYECSFTGIPKKNQYRPQRDTKTPTIISTTARVYSAADDQTLAQRNEVGRYQVTFDFMNEEAGKISNWIRHASHTARSNHLDMPLTPGTEVQIGFIGGNPNRPYILNALENSQSDIHPVTSANPHHAAIITDGMLYTAALKSRQSLHITSDFDPTDVKDHINSNVLQQLDLYGETSSGSAIDTVKGDVHINRLYGNQYQWREGVDFNYGTNASFSFGSQYSENHAEKTNADEEIFDLSYKLNKDDDVAANKARNKQGKLGKADFVTAPERLVGLVQKDWGNAYSYHEGYAYNWSSGPKKGIHKTFNFGGCYVENNTTAKKAEDLLNKPFTDFVGKNKPSGDDLITKTIGHTFDLHKGDKIDVHNGDSKTDMVGNTVDTIIGDVDSSIVGDIGEVIKGAIDSTITGNIDTLHTGNLKSEMLGNIINEHIGNQENTTTGSITDTHTGVSKSIQYGAQNNQMYGISKDEYFGGKMDLFQGAVIESLMSGTLQFNENYNINKGKWDIHESEIAIVKRGKASIFKADANIQKGVLIMIG